MHKRPDDGGGEDVETRSGMTVIPIERIVEPSADGAVKKSPLIPPQVPAGFAWCFCSFTMMLTNKLLLSSFDFNAPLSLLFIQFIMTVVLIDTATVMDIFVRDSLDWRIVQIWWPLNLIFVGMIISGFYSLKTLQIPMVTLLKNLTNLLSILGDLFFYGKRYTFGVWASLALMTLSAAVGAVTDLQFDLVGYLWMSINCISTAGYALYLKFVLNQVDDVTSKKGLSDISKVYYNHLLGLPWLLLSILWFGEAGVVFEQPALYNPSFLSALAFSGLVGFGLSYASICFMAMTNVTTYVMVGSFNKLPTAILGWIFFQVQTTMVNVASVIVGLCAGIVFVHTKIVNAK